MSHVDDGELAAYADGAYQVDDPVALRIAEHLSTCGNCRTRLEQNHDLRARAAEILGFATPGVVAVPAFDELQAQLAPARRSHRTFPLAWAASIVLALGLGWFGRGVWQQPQLASMERTPAAATETPPSDVPAVQEEQQASAPASAVTTAPTATPKPQPLPARVAAADHARGAATDAVAAAAGAEALQFRQEAKLSAAPAPPPPPPPLHVISGLPVLRVAAEGAALLVEQALPDGKVVQLLIAERAAAADAKIGDLRALAATHEVVVTRAGKRITVRADLPQDSLRALAEKIR